MALIVARAFVASTVLDYVLSPRLADDLGPGVPPLAPGQVSITGHSRNGKQSLLAAAFDARITAVVGSSPGAPISSPYHFSSHNFYGEGPDAGVAGSWWLPSITQYTEHPETLPMDGHGVLALVAPRACAVADGWTDHEGDLTFADEAAVKAARGVYALLGAPANLTLMCAPRRLTTPPARAVGCVSPPHARRRPSADAWPLPRWRAQPPTRRPPWLRLGQLVLRLFRCALRPPRPPLRPRVRRPAPRDRRPLSARLPDGRGLRVARVARRLRREHARAAAARRAARRARGVGAAARRAHCARGAVHLLRGGRATGQLCMCARTRPPRSNEGAPGPRPAGPGF